MKLLLISTSWNAVAAPVIAISISILLASTAGLHAEEIYAALNDTETQVQSILGKHCARCHQTGKLEGGREKPAKNFGNILQLDQLVADPSRVKPGNPDGSRIFQLIVNKEMPYDVFLDVSFDKPTPPAPTAEEIALLRGWLEGAAEKNSAGCLEGTGSYASGYDEISRDLGTLPEHRRKGARYITLANLALNCGSQAEMEVFRQGVAKLLNSLSSQPDPVGPFAIDKDKTILRFNIEDLGWTPELWEHIVGLYPYGVRPTGGSYEFVAHATLTKVPLLRGDWLAFTASRPPLYEKILGLPDTFQALQQHLGVDVSKNISNYTAKRAGFQKSGVSQNNRLIERHPVSTGAFWTSYDFGGNRKRQSLFEFPLGPGGEVGFEHDGGESIFNLPNGYQAYYLNKANGEALAKGPTEIVRDLSRRDLTVTNGISCMGCHDQGIRNAKDEIRTHIDETKVLSSAVREAVRALHPTHEEMDKLIEGDRRRFQDALRLSNVDPQLKLNGVEVINALSDWYERELDLNAAAAEFGVPVEKLQTSMAMAGGSGASLVTRLKLGTVQRDRFETAFGELVERIIDGEFISPSASPAQVTAVKADAKGGLKLELYADKASYVLGDKPVFTVASNKDCHLTLVDVDGAGDTVVIFPNKFQQENVIKAHTVFQFPNENSGFEFQLSTKGTETVIAICDETGTSLSEVAHNYGTEDFTNLGKGKLATRKIDVIAKKAKQSGQEVSRTAIKLKVE
jgi:Domain of unknown function (DUF4384)